MAETNAKRYLDQEGLSALVAKIKSEIAAAKEAAEAPLASKTTAGIVKPADGLKVGSDGALSITAGNGLKVNSTKDGLEVDSSKFKTVNGTSVFGAGNITIDLTLFKVVASLPSAPAAGDENKIHLVASTVQGAPNDNKYVEYLWDGTKFEKIGEYASSVDLSPYLLKSTYDTKMAALDSAIAGKADKETTLAKADATLTENTTAKTVTIKLGDATATALTAHQSLAEYATTSAVDTKLASYAKTSDFVSITEDEINELFK